MIIQYRFNLVTEMNNFLKQTPKIILILVGLNILFFAFSQLDNQWLTTMALYFFQNSRFQAWQLISHMFMHGGLMHLFFNMFALISFGSAIVYLWGSKRFIIFYFACGLGAAILHTLVNWYFFQSNADILLQHGYSLKDIVDILNQEQFYNAWQQILSAENLEQMLSSFIVPVVGASGAIYGLLIAFAMLFPNAELMFIFIPAPIKAKILVPIILAIDLIGGFTGGISLFGSGSGIAHFAHLGGAITGFLLSYFWMKQGIISKPHNIYGDDN